MFKRVLVIGLLSLFVVLGLGAEDAAEVDLDELARQLNNPVGATWNLVYQNNSTWYTGTDIGGSYDYINTFNFQPVLPIPIGTKLNFINRPVLPLVIAPSSPGSTDYVLGLGDLVWAAWIGPQSSEGFLWGLGLTTTFPTATDNILPYNDWTAGPSYILFYLGRPWMFGLIGQHWWSYAGDKEEITGSNTNFSNLQYIVVLSLKNQWQLQMSPNITLDFNDWSSFTFPIGLGATKIVQIGQSRWSFGAELQYYVIKPDDYAPEWNLRIVIKQILNNPFL